MGTVLRSGSIAGSALGSRRRASLLASVVASTLAVAACDQGGDGGQGADETSSDSEGRLIAGEAIDNVRAAGASAWPDRIEAVDSVAGVALTRANLVAVLDMSGSMSEHYCAGDFPSRAEAARAALAAWLDSVPEAANLGRGSLRVGHRPSSMFRPASGPQSERDLSPRPMHPRPTRR